MEKVYDNGDLQEIVIYKHNQVFYDLLIKINAIQRFVMQNDVYVLNILQFPSLKLNELQSKYDNHYKNSRIEDYYFSKGFKDQRTITLIDGTASIVYQKTIFDTLPKTIQQQIEQQSQPTKSDNDLEVIEKYINPFEKLIRYRFKTYKAKQIIQISLKILIAITFDENVATFHGSVFSLLPSMKYSVKDNKIYVDTEQGIWVFDIIDATTIECKTSIFKGERFRK